MSMHQILADVRSLPGILEIAPEPGSDHPPLAWGDHFFYAAPDGEIPQNRQPYATIITKDYPDDVSSRLDEPGRWRLNINTGRAALAELIDDAAPAPKPDAADVILRHPLHGAHGWVCIVTPGTATLETARRLLRRAHAAELARFERRRGPGSHPSP